MSVKPKILLVDAGHDSAASWAAPLEPACELVRSADAAQAIALLARGEFNGACLAGDEATAEQLQKLAQNERILEGMADGVVLLGKGHIVLWANEQFRQWVGRDDVAGANFFSLLGGPDILGPDFCPFSSALSSGRASSSTLRATENRHFHVHASPLALNDRPPEQLVVTVRDVTAEQLGQQKLAAILKAGTELADLTPEELQRMSVEERIELLKANILHFTKDLLDFDVVEIRLLEYRTGRLRPLLSVGLLPEATQRDLYAQPTGNGVTGFVAATGKSYLCEDTTADPLYLEGCRGAKSSLTVPLILHDEVIGTFNVESPEPRAFSEADLQFLQIFVRDVAVALNTLELLVAEKAMTTNENVEAIHGAVARPVDEILNDAVNVMERYIGHDPDVVAHLQSILRNARDIKQLIQRVGQQLSPTEALPQLQTGAERPLLVGKRILVADADDAVREAAHNLLERYGCTVETAHDGAEALAMVRNSALEAGYDVILTDIRLPDLSGFELLVKLQELIDPVPLILMTGFGYDPGHSIPKARQAGLPSYALLYKPFRLDQLLATIEKVVAAPRAVSQS